MKAHLTKVSLALLSAAFLLGCQDLGSGAVGPDGLEPQFAKPSCPGHPSCKPDDDGGGGDKTNGVYSVTFTDPSGGDDIITGSGGTSPEEGPATVDITNTKLALWGDHGVDFTIPITQALFDCFDDPRAVDLGGGRYTIHRPRGALTIIAGTSENGRPANEAELAFGIRVQDAKGLWIPYVFQTFGDIVGDFLPATELSSVTVTGTVEDWTLENSGGKKGRACAADSGTVSFEVTVTLESIR